MQLEPYAPVAKLEKAVADYTGAPFCVAVNSCTNALFLSLKYFDPKDWCVEIPKLTYVGVAQAILNAGAEVKFRDEEWQGQYRLDPYPIIDAARRFTSGMYRPGFFQCISFQASKILGDSQGGAILTDKEQAANWFRRARFDGRTEGVVAKDDTFTRGWHCYMSPDVAARLLLKLYSLPKHNADLPRDDYPDLSLQEIFK